MSQITLVLDGYPHLPEATRAFIRGLEPGSFDGSLTRESIFDLQPSWGGVSMERTVASRGRRRSIGSAPRIPARIVDTFPRPDLATCVADLPIALEVSEVSDDSSESSPSTPAPNSPGRSAKSSTPPTSGNLTDSAATLAGSWVTKPKIPLVPINHAIRLPKVQISIDVITALHARPLPSRFCRKVHANLPFTPVTTPLASKPIPLLPKFLQKDARASYVARPPPKDVGAAPVVPKPAPKRSALKGGRVAMMGNAVVHRRTISWEDVLELEGTPMLERKTWSRVRRDQPPSVQGLTLLTVVGEIC